MKKRKVFKKILGVVIIICIVAGVSLNAPCVAKTEEDSQYKRLICHNPDVTYYVAVDEKDTSKPYVATNKDYGWDYTVWIEEDTGETTPSGNRIVRLKNYGTQTYMGVKDNSLIMLQEEESVAVKWEVEIKKDYEGSWGNGQSDFLWNRYKTLNSDHDLYFCTEKLNGGEGTLSLEAASDDWWSNQWKYESVMADEMVNQPGEVATAYEKAALLTKINEAYAILLDEEGYQTKSLKTLQSVISTAEKVYNYVDVTNTTVKSQITTLENVISRMVKAEDSLLYAQGEMAIADQEQIGDKGKYYLDFAEEFDEDMLNTDIWLDEYLPHWTADEKDSKARYEIRDGKLALQIRKEDQPWSTTNDGNVICSGITTFNKNQLHNFTGLNTLFEHPNSTSTDNNYFNGYTTRYGYIEMRAKMEDDGGQGHQALWLVGTQNDSESWSGSKQTAEIDMLETSFYDSYRNWRLCGYGWNDSSFCPQWYASDAAVPSGDPGKEYHTYGIEWTPEKLNFYYDGQYYRSINYSPQYEMGIILSIYQNAGWSTGDKESGADWPKEMLVDYIRVYKPIGGYDTGYIDSRALERLVERAMIEAAKTDVYTVDTIENLNKSIYQAKVTLNDSKITKADILKKLNALEEAIDALEMTKLR